MPHETELPCSNCGADLVEATVAAAEVPGDHGPGSHVAIAECPDCGARYYPDETLVRLSDSTH